MLKKIKDLFVITPIIISLVTIVVFFMVKAFIPEMESLINATASLNIACAILLTVVAALVTLTDGLVKTIKYIVK